MIFTSTFPRLEIPNDTTIWDWLFNPNSPDSPLNKSNRAAIAGYTNAATGERLDYQRVRECTTFLSTALVKRYGLQPGETVALFSPNTVWYPVAMLGTIRIGGVVSGASPAYNVDEMTYALKTANAKILMTLPASMKVAAAAAERAGIPQSRIFLLEGEMDGYTNMQELLKIGQSYGNQVPAFEIPRGKKSGDICGFLSFSSGTTGLPKAVMISHYNVIAQCYQVRHLTPEDHKKILAVLPLFHITGLVHQLHLPVFLNAEVYMLPAFTMESMLKAIVKYQIPDVLLVPPIIIRLVHDPVVNNFDLSHIRRFSSGAAPLSAKVIQQLERKFPGTGFKQGYGMTESCSCITAHPPDRIQYKYANRGGMIVSNTEVKIIDPDNPGRELGYDEPGEILARGPQIVMGYLNNEKATRETFDADGWLHTGDIGFIDREGFITITDRIKEMIKVKGIAVAPAELEDLLLGHPAVEDAAVLSIPDDYTGERPKAYVVAKRDAGSSGSSSKTSEKERLVSVGRQLLSYVKENRVRHKWITEIEFIDEIPKSASGKILRRVLRDLEKKNRGKENDGKRVIVREEPAARKASAKL